VNSLWSNVLRAVPTRWVLLLVVAASAGCGRGQVQVYKVAKEPAAPETQMAQAAPAAMPPGHPDVSGAGAPPALRWKTPAGWEEVAPGEMRVASFKVKGDGGKQADVSVIPLPGLAGSDLDNVNRWRGQVSEPPISQEELAKIAQPVEVAGQPAQLYEQAGQNPGSGDKTRILAAIQRREGTAWFFKMTGDDDLVAKQKPAFVEFLKSLEFAAAPASPQLPPSHPPIGGGAPAPAGSEVSAEGKPAWQVPAGWQEVPAGQFLVAKFTITGTDNSQAAVNVSRSAGQGGGVAGNVNRWRGQLGLSPLPEGEMDQSVKTVDLEGGKAMFVDMTGSDARSGQRARLVGAILPRGDDTWFFKLMGNEQVVGREKDAFDRFVRSAKFP